MSWSASSKGFAPKVAEELAEEFKRSRCAEPEESVRRHAVAMVLNALNDWPKDLPVEVSMNGSMSTAEGRVAHDLNVQIKPIWGFRT